MNKIPNRFLLLLDKFIPGMLLRQCKFVNIACGTFIVKNKRQKKNLKWKYKIYLSKRVRQSLHSARYRLGRFLRVI